MERWGVRVCDCNVCVCVLHNKRCGPPSRGSQRDEKTQNVLSRGVFFWVAAVSGSNLLKSVPVAKKNYRVEGVSVKPIEYQTL